MDFASPALNYFTQSTRNCAEMTEVCARKIGRDNDSAVAAFFYGMGLVAGPMFTVGACVGDVVLSPARALVGTNPHTRVCQPWSPAPARAGLISSPRAQRTREHFLERGAVGWLVDRVPIATGNVGQVIGIGVGAFAQLGAMACRGDGRHLMQRGGQLGATIGAAVGLAIAWIIEVLRSSVVSVGELISGVILPWLFFILTGVECAILSGAACAFVEALRSPEDRLDRRNPSCIFIPLRALSD